jgi:hypothetical protein
VFSSIRDIYRTIEAVRDAPKARFDSRTGRLFATPPPSANSSTRSSSTAAAGADHEAKDNGVSELPTPCAFRASVLHHERRTLRAYCRKFTTPRIPVSVASMSASGTLGRPEPRPAQQPQQQDRQPRDMRSASAQSNDSAFTPAGQCDEVAAPQHLYASHVRPLPPLQSAPHAAAFTAPAAERGTASTNAAGTKPRAKLHGMLDAPPSRAAAGMTPDQKRRLVERLLVAEGDAPAAAPRPAAPRPRDRSIL